MNLSNKYRPQTFEDVLGQKSVIKILSRQIETHQFVNCYLFSGKSGVGKTTLARIFANKINKGLGEPIEIDAASNNSVDNVRLIAEQATQRSLDSEYKVYIIDECQGLSNSAWSALLKLIEETPKYTIFMFCTTELQKVPETIQNRCQQYRLSRVKDEDIFERLRFICTSERLRATDESLMQITKMSSGSVRQAIAYLDKVKDFSQDIKLSDVITVLGDFSYDVYFTLLNAIIDKNDQTIINTIDDLYNKGSDLKLFVELFLKFLLDLTKYIIFKSYDIIKIPVSCKGQVDYVINVDGALNYYKHLIDRTLELKQLIKGDSSIKTTIEIFLLTKV